jgi:hypothetical protein
MRGRGVFQANPRPSRGGGNPEIAIDKIQNENNYEKYYRFLKEISKRGIINE